MCERGLHRASHGSSRPGSALAVKGSSVQLLNAAIDRVLRTSGEMSWYAGSSGAIPPPYGRHREYRRGRTSEAACTGAAASRQPGRVGCALCRIRGSRWTPQVVCAWFSTGNARWASACAIYGRGATAWASSSAGTRAIPAAAAAACAGNILRWPLLRGSAMVWGWPQGCRSDRCRWNRCVPGRRRT